MTNNTIFDDVFRTMVEKMTYLVVPLINEVFHTAYPRMLRLFSFVMNISWKMGRLLPTPV